MTKRPNVFDLNSLMVRKPDVAVVAPSTADESAAPPVAVASTPSKRAASAPPEMFRTSVYFSRAVHDKLREIAFEERKSVTDLINEGLDHVLTSRNYATTGELRDKKRP